MRVPLAGTGDSCREKRDPKTFVEALTARLESVVERTFVRVPPVSTEDQCSIYRKIEGKGILADVFWGKNRKGEEKTGKIRDKTEGERNRKKGERKRERLKRDQLS